MTRAMKLTKLRTAEARYNRLVRQEQATTRKRQEAWIDYVWALNDYHQTPTTRREGRGRR